MNTIKSLLLGIATLIGGWAGYAPQPVVTPSVAPVVTEAPVLGAFNPSGGGTYTLKASVGNTDTTLNLASFKEPVSNIKYTMSYLNTSIAYGTVDPKTTRSEFVSFTGITQNADGSAQLTGVSRGLTRTPAGSNCTASTTLAQRHAGQSIFILSDSPCLFAEYAVKRNNETIPGTWTFSSTTLPRVDVYVAPTTTTQFTPRGYIDALVLTGAGAIAASEVAQGYVELATQVETASSTVTGTAGPLVIQAKNATSSYNPNTAALRVVVTQNNGTIANGFIATTTLGVPPPGTIVAFGSTTTIPTSWLKTDGSAVSRTTYPFLFSAIGTNYGGGDGSTTFNLPFSKSNIGGPLLDNATLYPETTSTVHTYSHTTAPVAGLLVVFVNNPGTSSRTISSVTYNGVAMTLAISQVVTGTQGVQMYYLKNPASGTNNVVITGSGSLAIASVATSYVNVSNLHATNGSLGSGISTTTSFDGTTLANDLILVGSEINGDSVLGTYSNAKILKTQHETGVSSPVFGIALAEVDMGMASTSVPFVTGGNFASVLAAFSPASTTQSTGYDIIKY